MDNDDNLLISLSKYPRRIKGNPKENFLTEAFAWLLRSNDGFSDFFLDKIREETTDNNKPSLKAADARWKTQYNLDGKFPDMVFATEEEAFIFEHKVYSEVTTEQLKNYTEGAKKWCRYCLILITAYPIPKTQIAHVEILWRNIYKWIDDWLKENPKLEDNTQKKFTHFQEYLIFEELGPAAPISHQAIFSYFETKKLETNILSLLGSISSDKTLEFWNFTANFKIPDNPDNSGRQKKERWGRMGIDLFYKEEDWLPNVFIGFILNPTDHNIDPINKEKGPDVAIILDIDKKIQNDYHKNDDYKRLVKRLEKNIPKNPDLQGWEFYNHREVEKTKYNPWHPFYIRKPMLDLFKGEKSFDKQKEVFSKELGTILEILFKKSEIENMRKTFSQNNEETG